MRTESQVYRLLEGGTLNIKWMPLNDDFIRSRAIRKIRPDMFSSIPDYQKVAPFVDEPFQSLTQCASTLQEFMSDNFDKGSKEYKYVARKLAIIYQEEELYVVLYRNRDILSVEDNEMRAVDKALDRVRDASKYQELSFHKIVYGFWTVMQSQGVQ